MSNPFPSKFEQGRCQQCGARTYEGDMIFIVDEMFIDKDCAEENGNVCVCGKYKDEDHDLCYACGNATPSEDMTTF